MHRLRIVFLAALAWSCGIAPAMAEKRVALVVGNSAYQNIARLDNPKNDAVLMADTLRGLGFTLIGGEAQLNLDKVALDAAVESFGHQIQNADVSLFYYAGHGVQVSGVNYLVPVNANPTRETDVDFQMVDVNLVLRQMQGSGNGSTSSSSMPAATTRSARRGLRSADGGPRPVAGAGGHADEGTRPSPAASPCDGDDGHSVPYTRALATTIRQTGLDTFQTFNQVGLAVKRETNGSQQPWVSSSPDRRQLLLRAAAALGLVRTNGGDARSSVAANEHGRYLATRSRPRANQGYRKPARTERPAL